MTNTPSSSQQEIKEVYPYLHVNGAAEAIAFYIQAFGARERLRLTEPGGRIGHAELELGNIILMLADENPEYGIVGPQTLGGTSFTIHLHVDNADAMAARAVAAGATVVRELADQGHGERQCRLRDPFGHEWLLGHQIEEVSPEEIQRRFTASFSMNKKEQR